MGELLGADTDLLDRVAESLSTGAEQLQDVRGAAQRAVTELQASWRGPDLLQLTQQWGQQVSLLLAEVSASLGVCAAQLRAQSAAQRTASRTDTGSFTAKPVPMPLLLTPPGSPTATGQPAKAATWWRSLSPEQQHQVITNHPDWIGNRDGIPFTARDLANRALVSVARDRLSAQTEQMLTDGERLKRAMTSSPSKGVLTAGSVALGNGALGNAALGNVEAKLASLQAIDATLAQPGDRQLLLLDLSKERAQAAIARGNVDTADNVTVVVPGLSTNVNSMLTNDRTMGDLQRHTELESGRAHTGQGTATTATVMWVGYQAPQLGWDLVGDNSVALDLAARKGAAQLVPFLQGIGAARDTAPHLTLLGHSYGSATAGLALRQDTGVDDGVFFGSPGLGTNQVADLKLAPGHLYYLEARQDPVGDLGRTLGPFGMDPSHLAGVEQVSTKDSAVVDPLTGEVRHFDEVTGHSSYLKDRTTSLYNLSVIAAGLPGQRIRDDDQGVGDFFSWPIPGTY